MSTTAVAEKKIANVANKASKMEIATTLIPGKVAIALMTPDKLHALKFISTYSSRDPQSTSPQGHGYQRDPDESRFAGIGRHYHTGENRFHIPNLLVSVRVYEPKQRTRFNTLFNQGAITKIHKEFGESVFSILDGQHREGGLFYAWKKWEDFNAMIPITLYYGMTFEEEARLFDEINTKQKKLPTALIEATKVHLEAGEESHAQKLREIALSVAQDKDSVWKDKINMTGASRTGLPVTYAGLRRSVGRMLPAPLLTRLEDRGLNPERVVKRFWEFVTKACDAAWNEEPVYVEVDGETVQATVKYRLKHLVGVSAIFRLGADIASTALDKSATNEDFWKIMEAYVSKLSEVDWIMTRSNPWTATSAGFGGSDHLYSMLYELVYMDKTPGDEVVPE